MGHQTPRPAKEAAAAKAEAKRNEELDKMVRRSLRDAARRRKNAPGHAQCGINWYPMNSGWTHCHKCGQALVYTTDPDPGCTHRARQFGLRFVPDYHEGCFLVFARGSSFHKPKAIEGRNSAGGSRLLVLPEGWSRKGGWFRSMAGARGF